MPDINLRSVVATTSAGGGFTTLRRMCTDFNFPQPVNEHPYSKYITFIEKKTMENCNQSLSVAAKHLRKLKSKGADNQIIDIPVSVDGSWQKRYGFNSLLGMIFIISIDTGCVLDFIIKSLFCHVCKENPNA